MKYVPTLTPPVFLQKLNWVLNPTQFMEKSVTLHPDIFRCSILQKKDNIVFVINPQGIQELLTNDRKRFPAYSRLNAILQPLVGSSAVVMLEGDRHKRERQLLMPPFHGDRMRTYSQLICDLTRQVFSQIPANTPFVARTAAQTISLSVILEAVFGLTQGERYQAIKHLLVAMVDMFSSPLSSTFLFFPALQKDLGPYSPWGQFLRRREQLDQLLYAEIGDRRAHPDPNRVDILSLLMSARDEQGEPMTDRELRDELMILMVAGHETTATAIAWALYWVHRTPRVLEKLRHELDSLGSTPDLTSMVRLPYLTAVCNEALRIYPVAMLTFGRGVPEQTELMGYTLAPETVVFGCIYLLHHREDLYPEPLQFRPERFLERQFSPYEFMPFGGGVRRCVGEALAIVEMKLVLGTVLAQYDLALADTEPEQASRRGVTLAPAKGVRMVMQGQRVQ